MGIFDKFWSGKKPVEEQLKAQPKPLDNPLKYVEGAAITGACGLDDPESDHIIRIDSCFKDEVRQGQVLSAVLDRLKGVLPDDRNLIVWNGSLNPEGIFFGAPTAYSEEILAHLQLISMANGFGSDKSELLSAIKDVETTNMSHNSQKEAGVAKVAIDPAYLTGDKESDLKTTRDVAAAIQQWFSSVSTNVLAVAINDRTIAVSDPFDHNIPKAAEITTTLRDQLERIRSKERATALRSIGTVEMGKLQYEDINATAIVIELSPEARKSCANEDVVQKKLLALQSTVLSLPGMADNQFEAEVVDNKLYVCGRDNEGTGLDNALETVHRAVNVAATSMAVSFPGASNFNSEQTREALPGSR